jgi:hypothetical protein
MTMRQRLAGLGKAILSIVVHAVLCIPLFLAGDEALGAV